MESVLAETDLRAKHLIVGGLFLICTIILCYAEILLGMAEQWFNDSNYSHGFLVPVISGYIIWKNKKTLSLADICPARKGLFLVVSGLLLLIIGKAGGEFFTMRVSFIVVLFGLLLFIMGTEITKKILFPISFLVFMIPLPYVLYNDISFPLRLLTVTFSTKIISLLEIPFLREGNIIHLKQTSLHIVDACSGLRSIMSLSALAVLLAYLIQNSIWRKLLLVLLTIPIAVIVNTIRITPTATAVHRWGHELTEGIFHDLSGMVSFALAFILLAICGFLLKRKRP
jgi:exosortase